MTGVNNFDVLKEMGERDLDLRGFPLSDNLVSASISGKNGKITILVSPQTAKDILTERPMVGMLIIADKKQFDSVKGELSAATHAPDLLAEVERLRTTLEAALHGLSAKATWQERGLIWLAVQKTLSELKPAAKVK